MQIGEPGPPPQPQGCTTSSRLQPLHTEVRERRLPSMHFVKDGCPPCTPCPPSYPRSKGKTNTAAGAKWRGYIAKQERSDRLKFFKPDENSSSTSLQRQRWSTPSWPCNTLFPSCPLNAVPLPCSVSPSLDQILRPHVKCMDGGKTNVSCRNTRRCKHKGKMQHALRVTHPDWPARGN